MDPIVLGLTGLAVLLVLLFLRVPIAVALASVGFVGLVLAVGWPEGRALDLARGLTAAWAFLSFEPYAFIASFTLVALADNSTMTRYGSVGLKRTFSM